MPQQASNLQTNDEARRNKEKALQRQASLD
jgi:hypothetical protein